MKKFIIALLVSFLAFATIANASENFTPLSTQIQEFLQSQAEDECKRRHIPPIITAIFEIEKATVVEDFKAPLIKAVTQFKNSIIEIIDCEPESSISSLSSSSSLNPLTPLAQFLSSFVASFGISSEIELITDGIFTGTIMSLLFLVMTDPADIGTASTVTGLGVMYLGLALKLLWQEVWQEWPKVWGVLDKVEIEAFLEQLKGNVEQGVNYGTGVLLALIGEEKDWSMLGEYVAKLVLMGVKQE